MGGCLAVATNTRHPPRGLVRAPRVAAGTPTGGTAVSADNYYLIRKREDGKFCAVMGFASDDHEPTVEFRHKSFATVVEAVLWASDEYTEYGVRVHPECGSDRTPATISLQRRLFDECESAGWDPDKRNTFAEECAHLHEEVSEAFREWRLNKNFDINYDDRGKPGGIPIELADVLIGLFYNAELHGFDLLSAVEIKHAYNLSRSYHTEGRQLHPNEVSS